MAGTTRLELATSAVTDIKRCRRTSFDTTRYRMSLLIVPLLYPDRAELLNFSEPIPVADYSGVGKRHQRTWPWQRLSLVTDAETLQLTLKSDSRGNARVHYQSRGVFATLTV